MIAQMVRRGLVLAVFSVAGAALAVGAETPAAKNDAGKAPASSSAASRSSTQSRTGAAKGALPDPALLDGSSQPAEKRSEHGMLGDFEIPGDENVRSDRVGGGQQMPQGGGAQGLPTALPQGAMGGAQGAQRAMAGQAGAQSGAAGQQAQNAPGGAASGAPADPNAGGMQASSAQAGGDASGQQGGDMAQKPPQVAIGDASMKVGGTPAGNDVVGAQQVADGQTQHHEKGTGTGGRGAGGSGGNRGAERGRAMPSGL